MKKSELLEKLAKFSDDAELVFEIDGESADEPYIFPSMRGIVVNREIVGAEDLDCCIIKFT